MDREGQLTKSGYLTGSGSGVNSDGVSIPWNHPDRVLPVYHQMIFDNTRSAACRACDDLLKENRTYRMHSPSTCRNPIHGHFFNWRDDALDYCWYISFCQQFVWRISFGNVSISDFSLVSVTIVSSYQWIAFWIAFGEFFFNDHLQNC